jgi:hypothetical protein
MSYEASVVGTLTADQLDAVSGGVATETAILLMGLSFVAGLAVGTYLKYREAASSGGSKPGDYPTPSNNTAPA